MGNDRADYVGGLFGGAAGGGAGFDDLEGVKMADIAEMLQAQARIIPIRPDNRVKEIEKMADGSMRVTQHSGDVFTVSPGDELFQAFAVYSVLAEL